MSGDPVGRTGAPATRDYFAEMYVSGMLADAGWDIYFPRRDKGFDMIVSRPVPDGVIVRPVQVKGKYATEEKTDKPRYGFVGRLTALYADMVLAVPFFTSADAAAPRFIAWADRGALKSVGRGHAFQPAAFRSGVPVMRPSCAGYFGEAGLRALARAGVGEHRS